MSSYTQKNGFSDMKVNDIHWHIMRQYPINESLAHIKKEMDYLNVEKMCILALEQEAEVEFDNSSNIKALYLRDRGEGRIFALASIRHFGDERDNADEFLRQVKLYYELGFDGIKILEGKTPCHKAMHCKLDGENYAPMFKFLEEKQFPLLIHVGDYIAYPNEENLAERESIHREMLNVLERHPNLRVIFAHVFNMSYDRERLDKLMETYQNMSVDLALGGDFLINFSKDIKEWEKFFTKYSDRVIYGTDTYNMYFEENDDFEITGRHTPIHKFFEWDEPFSDRYYEHCPEAKNGTVMIKPAKLPENVVKDIYYNSFIKALADKPRTTDRELALKYCEELLEGYNSGKLSTKALAPMPDWISPTEQANMKRGHALALENIEVIKAYYQNK